MCDRGGRARRLAHEMMRAVVFLPFLPSAGGTKNPTYERLKSLVSHGD